MRIGALALLSPHNARVGRLRRLSRDRRARSELGLFVIDGPTLVADALGAGVEVVDAFVVPGRVPDELLDRLSESGAAVAQVAEATLGGATDPVTPQGIAVVARSASLPGPPPPGAVEHGPLLALDAVAEPGNVGALLRSAEAAGAAGVLVGTGSADAHAPKVVRAAAGSRFWVPLATGSLPDLLAEHGRGARCLGAAAGRGLAYDEGELAGPVVVVVGSEAHGVSASVAGRLDGWVHVPTSGVESLNVAMAGTLLLFEAARQRRANGFAHDPHGRQGSRR